MKKIHFFLLASLFLGIFVAAKYDDTFFALKKNFTIFGKLYEELAVGYVDPIDPTKFMRVGINSMMQSLDPYTVYYDEADNEDGQLSQLGGLGSVGIGVGKREGKMVVLEMLEGYSGAEQGVRIGDTITHLGDKAVDKMTVREVMDALNGEPNSAVSLRIKRGNADATVFTLVRKKLEVKNVPYSGFVADDSTRGIGYIRLTQFGRGCASEVYQAAKKLKDSGKLKSLIFDLRGNPGGLLDQAINIVSMFVPEGSKIVSTKGRFAQSEQGVSSATPPILGPDVPLVILIDHNSASASEVVSGAVQDLDRGVIMGQTSYGKGLVQNVKSLPYNTSMKLTIAKYYTPSGRCIQAINYSARDENGKPLPVPDSLRKAFTTKNGRTVKDGRGVDPDVMLPNGEATELEAALQQKASFLFFANEFASKNATISPNFEVTDRTYADFQTWLKGQNFSFQTQSEKSLNGLKNELEKAGFGQSSRKIADIQRQIEQDKAQEFTRHADRLKQLLKSQILARYFGPTAQIKVMLAGDPAMKEAEKLIMDRARYDRLLKP
jgi:carboxyl-terminal processing protease